ncbi:MAG: hypothetical protein ACTS9Y_07615 [Methylophilus sp.]|uniref:hypothetical protein n=1 Tax=Methylophilus sp. TaxID=29541 RepID=UPI003FA0861F
MSTLKKPVLALSRGLNDAAIYAGFMMIKSVASGLELPAVRQSNAMFIYLLEMTDTVGLKLRDVSGHCDL